MNKKVETSNVKLTEPIVRPSTKPLRDSALRTSANWVSQIVISAVLIISARHYSFDEFSFLVTALAISTALVSLVDLGTTAQWTVMISKKTISLSRWKNLLEFKLSLAILIVLMSCLASVIVGPLAIASSLFFFLVLTQQSLNVFFSTTSRNYISAYSAILDRTVALSLCLGFLFFPIHSNQMFNIYLPFLIGPLSSTIYLFLNTPKHLRPRILRRFKLGLYAKQSKWFAINSLSSSLRGIDVVLLGSISNTIQTSLYSSVSKMIVPLNTAATALSSVTTPHFSSLGLNIKALRDVKSSIVLLFLICGVALTPILFSRELVIFLLGSKYAEAAPILSILLISGVASAFGIVFTSTLEATGKAFSASLVNILAFGFQVGLCLVLIPIFGAIGAAYALAASTGIAVLVHIFLVAKVFRETNLSG